MGEYWPNRQNPDGQFGGGWNDDATHLLQSVIDVTLDGNQKMLDAVNKWRHLFEETDILKDGYENMYPQDTHHTKDIAFGSKPLVLVNLGGAHEMKKAMEIGLALQPSG